MARCATVPITYRPRRHDTSVAIGRIAVLAVLDATEKKGREKVREKRNV